MDIKFPTRKQIDDYINKTGRHKIRIDADEAQKLMYDAWQSDDYLSMLQFIKKALKKSPLCADAYTFYYDISDAHASSCLPLLENAVYVSECILEQPIEKLKGYCWGLIETRPYMRAKACLAGCLWDLGRYDESLSHYKAMLELNPEDNQGIRYLLITYYLELEKINELEHLLSIYSEDIDPIVLYTKALLAYRKSLPSAKQFAHDAIASNHYIPDYLNQRIKQPQNLVDPITMGGKNQALEYVNTNLLPWIRTKGSIDWIVAISQELRN